MKFLSFESMAYFLLAGVLAACAPTADLKATQSGSGAARAGPTLAQFSDIPIPRGAAMDLERSLIFGPGDGWIGRLVYTTSLSTQDAFDFYGREMSAFGWQEITRVRARINIMTYVRGARAATIQIEHRTLGGAEVNVTVSPQAQQPPAAGTAPTGNIVPVR
ncbi:MAG: hypothetical protein AB7P12_05780 [Alphaproteobacteria bacterium]